MKQEIAVGSKQKPITIIWPKRLFVPTCWASSQLWGTDARHRGTWVSGSRKVWGESKGGMAKKEVALTYKLIMPTAGGFQLISALKPEQVLPHSYASKFFVCLFKHSGFPISTAWHHASGLKCCIQITCYIWKTKAYVQVILYMWNSTQPIFPDA